MRNSLEHLAKFLVRNKIFKERQRETERENSMARLERMKFDFISTF